MRIGFAKIGRSWDPRLSRASTVGGDVDVIRSLCRLRDARKRDRFVMIGKTRVDPREQFPWLDDAPWYSDTSFQNARGNPSLEEPLMEDWAERLDALVIWLGQIGGAAAPLPKLDGSGPIKPLEMDVRYARYICHLVNVWRAIHPDRDVIWLCPDTRNRFSLHDFEAAPSRPILAQYDETRRGVFHNGDGTYHRDEYTYTYAGTELCAIAPPVTQPRVDPFKAPFGIVVNENRRSKKLGRAQLLREWSPVPIDELELYGKWTPLGLEDLGRTQPVVSVPVNELTEVVQRWATTLTLPASGSGWATSKPWEMFYAGVVCFFHPAYDDQGHVVALSSQMSDNETEAFLSKWLRPESPAELRERIDLVAKDARFRRSLVIAQRQHLHERFTYWHGGIARVLDRLRGTND